MSDDRTCPTCGKTTNWPEGSGACPTYHGMTFGGYCPIFVDGLTAAEQCEQFSGLIKQLHRENRELRAQRPHPWTRLIRTLREVAPARSKRF